MLWRAMAGARGLGRCCPHNRRVRFGQLVGMSAQADVEVSGSGGLSGRGPSEFEQVYRANVAALTAYFARRCRDPQTVADLTSETFVRAVGSFGSFDAGKGTARSWLFGIATRVYAQHCEQAAGGRDAAAQLAGRRGLEVDEIEELAARIDAEQAGRELLASCSQLPGLERTAVELVDLAGLTPKEAAAVLGVPRGVLRARLFRARARLRREQCDEHV